MDATVRHLLATVFAALFVGLPAAATAQMYTYETPDGETLMTTEPRNEPGYELIEEMSTPGDDASDSSADTREDSSQSSDSSSSETDYTPSTGSSDRPFSERENRYDEIIREAARAYDVPFGFIKAVMRIESAFQADAVSHAGAIGLMQLMPSTAEALDVDDPFDARQNIFGGARFLRILIDRYDGDINLILAAYNAGDVAVRRHDGIPYQATRQYVASVYHWYQQYEEDEP